MFVCPPGMLAFIALQTKEDRDKLSYIKVEFPQSSKEVQTLTYPVLTKHRFFTMELASGSIQQSSATSHWA